MKKLLIVLLLLAVAGGIGYYWWLQNSHQIVTGQVRKVAGSFFVNPESLTVKHTPVKMLGLQKARIAKLDISGNDLALRDGPQLASARLLLLNVEVSGPPFHLSRVGKGLYEVRVTDAAVTAYLHRRGGSVAGFKAVPLDTLSVRFLDAPGAVAQLKGEATIPIIQKQVPFSVSGNLVTTSSDPGQIDFRPQGVSIKKIRDSLRIVNPMVDLSGWPVNIRVESIKTAAGIATIRGVVTGANDSLLPRF